MRVLEQIKLDFCYPNLPGIILGDGAGLVYSTLGVSHQCAEDVSCLRALPNIKIFSPCDAEELKVCFEESLKHNGPAYIRVGKADRPKVHQTALKDTRAVRTFLPTGLNGRSKAAIVSMGSMVHVGHTLAGELGLASISVPRLKPLCENLLELLEGYDTVITLEEHNRHGGLYSSVCEAYFASSQKHPRLMPLSLEDRFSHLCGSYQYALSEHQMSDKQLFERVKDITR
jgi:transketolase